MITYGDVIQIRLMSNGCNKPIDKQIRKPVSSNFSPKRLAVSYDPPTIILEYLVIDNGKLYHHKIHLRYILCKPYVNRIDVLNYIKNQHFLYFVNGKIKDTQILKFIDRVLSKIKEKRQQNISKTDQLRVLPKDSSNQVNQKNVFNYLDDEQYEQDYEEDEEQPQDPIHQNSKQQIRKQLPNQMHFNKNTFMSYCQEEESYDQGSAEWDLELDASADFV